MASITIQRQVVITAIVTEGFQRLYIADLEDARCLGVPPAVGWQPPRATGTYTGRSFRHDEFHSSTGPRCH